MNGDGIMKKYDTIVVGAGFAGLICAGYLAKGGQKTLLLEKSTVIGGRAAAHPVDGFNPVMHLPLVMTTMNDGGGYGWANAAKEFGANVKLHYSREPRVYIKGSENPELVIPRCLTAEAAVDWMIEFLKAARPEMVHDDLKSILIPVIDEIFRKPFKEMCEEWDEISVKDWVQERTVDPSVQYIFTALMSGFCWTCNADVTWEMGSAAKGFVMLRIWMGSQGVMACAVPDLQHGICEPIADAIKKNYGCEIKTNAEVSQVLIENGKIIGVAAGDEVIHADNVVLATTNLDLFKFFEEVPPTLADTLQQAMKPNMGSTFMMYFLNDSCKLDGAFTLCYDPKSGSVIQGGCAQNVEQPWCAPEGKQFIWAYSVRAEEEFKRLGLEGIAAEVEENLELLYPGFHNALESKTPPKGGCYPSHYRFTSLPKVHIKSPDVEGLYFAGEYAWPMYGLITDGTASTGALAAKMILGLDEMAGL